MEHFFEFLSDADNSPNATEIGDYVFTAKKRRCRVGRMLVNIIDVGKPGDDKYGHDLILENGIQVLTKIGGEEQILTDLPIETNFDWSLYCYDSSRSSSGSGPQRVLVRWSFNKSGREIRLNRGDQVIVRIRDNLTDLNGHYFQLQGYYV